MAATGNKCVGYMRQTSNQKIKNEKKKLAVFNIVYQ